ncbi:unnamed protein product [Closterium sp. NIES-53]
MAAQELRWLTYLLTDLGEAPRSPPVLYVDNKAMLALCQEHRLEHRTKHIALRYFLARELQLRGQLCLAYVASQANTADVFSKALQLCDHQRFCTVTSGMGLMVGGRGPVVLTGHANALWVDDSATQRWSHGIPSALALAVFPGGLPALLRFSAPVVRLRSMPGLWLHRSYAGSHIY